MFLQPALAQKRADTTLVLWPGLLINWLTYRSLLL